MSHVFVGQPVAIRELSDEVWLLTFMHHDLGFFDHQTGRVTRAENHIGAKVLGHDPVSPMCPEWTWAAVGSSLGFEPRTVWQNHETCVQQPRYEQGGRRVGSSKFQKPVTPIHQVNDRIHPSYIREREKQGRSRWICDTQEYFI